MPLLPSDPRSQKALLGIILALALGVVYFNYVYSPKRERIAELAERAETLTFLNQQANSRVGNLDALRAELDTAERQLGVLERLIPGESEMPAIYEAIAGEAEHLGLKLVSVVPSQPAADSAGYFLHQDWDMTVEGGYNDIGDFLSRVASLDRIVRPQLVEIRPAGPTPSGHELVQASLSLQTYVLAPAATGAKGANAP